MTTEPVPDDVRRFVLTSIPSVPYLEALLLLHSPPRRPWDARSVAARLYVPETRAVELLRELEETSLVATDAGHALWNYQPQSEALAALVDRLAAVYTSHLVEITSMIHSRVDRRAMQFADAFRFKKEP